MRSYCSRICQPDVVKLYSRKCIRPTGAVDDTDRVTDDSVVLYRARVNTLFF